MRTIYFLFSLALIFANLSLIAQAPRVEKKPPSALPVNRKIIEPRKDNPKPVLSSSDTNEVISVTEKVHTNNDVNKNYGFSKSGIFYIHKSLIEESGGEIPCLVAGVTNWKKNVKMILDGDYYIYPAKVDNPIDVQLEYCFYIGNGNHIPQLLIEKSSSKILDGDYKMNKTLTGNNFYTKPQDYYPGESKNY